MNSRRFTRAGKLGRMSGELVVVLVLIVAGIVVWRLYVGGYIHGPESEHAPKVEQPAPEPTAPVAVVPVTPPPPPVAPAPAATAPVEGPQLPAELFRWRRYVFNGVAWSKEVADETLKIEERGIRQWGLTTVGHDAARAVMDGLDIRNGPIEYNVQFPAPRPGMVGLSSPFTADPNRYIGLPKVGAWTHIRMEVLAGQLVFSVNTVKVPIGDGHVSGDPIRPFIEVPPGPAVMVNSVHQTLTK